MQALLSENSPLHPHGHLSSNMQVYIHAHMQTGAHMYMKLNFDTIFSVSHNGPFY